MRLTIALVAATSAAFALGGCETVAETVSETYETTMTGAQEVPGPGDPDGTGDQRKAPAAGTAGASDCHRQRHADEGNTLPHARPSENGRCGDG